MKWKPFAFNNVRLSIPEPWDLTKFSGNCRRGDFVMDDGERSVADAQWGRFAKDDPSALEDKLVRQAKGVEVQKRFDLAEHKTAFLAQMDAGAVGIVLVWERALGRFLLLRVFDPPADFARMAKRLVGPLGQARTDEAQPWCFFSTAFEMPAGFILREAALKVGCMKLTFKRQRRELTIWDMSLLDQLEKRGKTMVFGQELMAKEYIKRFTFYADRVVEGEDPSEFTLPGRVKRRWLVNPALWLLGCRRIQLQGVANRERNRFTLLLFRYRKPTELDWLKGLPESLRCAEMPCWEN